MAQNMAPIAYCFNEQSLNRVHALASSHRERTDCLGGCFPSAKGLRLAPNDWGLAISELMLSGFLCIYGCTVAHISICAYVYTYTSMYTYVENEKHHACTHEKHYLCIHVIS